MNGYLLISAVLESELVRLSPAWLLLCNPDAGKLRRSSFAPLLYPARLGFRHLAFDHLISSVSTRLAPVCG
jgi:hypothetical protein